MLELFRDSFDKILIPFTLYVIGPTILIFSLLPINDFELFSFLTLSGRIKTNAEGVLIGLVLIIGGLIRILKRYNKNNK